MRKPNPKEFFGKTIKTVDTSSANMWEFYFTDGTSAKVWAELGDYHIPTLGMYDED